MKWRGRHESENVEDRRQTSVAAGAKGVGGVAAIVLLVVGYYLSVDVRPFLSGDVGPVGTEAERAADGDQAARFVSVVLADTETVWTEIFRTELNDTYRPPVLVLFTKNTQSPCGNASGATGPFYCPVDRKAYLDIAFFALLSNRLGAGGDFAPAYVVAHEVAHHIQNELGILKAATDQKALLSKLESNRISVMVELQADCFSGIWARYAEERIGSLEVGDIGEAMNAAKRIGDDTLQRAEGKTPMPHTFTHGTSEQRQRWFMIGYNTPRLENCHTFGAEKL